jgi:hypothetical protein
MHPKSEVCRATNGNVCATEGAQGSEKQVEHKNSRAMEMSAEATSGGRSSKSMPLSFSLTLTKAKEVWERLADGLGMGRRRFVLAGSEEVGLVESEEVLSEGMKEEGREGEAGEWLRMGVET